VLVDRHPDSELVPRALYAVTEWAPDNEEGNVHRQNAAARLQEEFTDTRWSYYHRLGMGEEPEKPTDLLAHEALLEAENRVDLLSDPEQWQPALPAFYRVVELFPSTESARKAELAAARLLELGAGPPDSARVAYERIVERYPDHPEARIAAERLGSSTADLLPDPLEARRRALEEEISNWNQWFGNQTAARVVRLQPRGQATRLALGRNLGARTIGQQDPDRVTGTGAEPPRRPPPGRPPPGGQPPPGR